ncbi:MAG: S8 family serine peptidase [Phycisphaeraceae bacterium]|nr:S8 family serine peptidase [Phycisphaeraceae bacterium]
MKPTADDTVTRGYVPCLTLFVFSACVYSQPLQPMPPHRPGQAIVSFDATYPISHCRQVLQAHGCQVNAQCRSGHVYQVIVDSSAPTLSVVDALNNEPSVAYAELNYLAYAHSVPNDPFFEFQWHLGDPNKGGINMPKAWDRQQGDPNVIVAILDTGVAYEDFGDFSQAPDLEGTRFVSGFDFVNNDTHPDDDQGHGTHIAGTIAQSTNNEQGVAGIAFGCSIMPVKVLDMDGVGDHFTIATGIYWAVDQGAQVLNMSLGSAEPSEVLRRAIAYAYENEVTVVCSAGNAFVDGNPINYPAAYDDHCIAVGASTVDRIRAYYSNTGDYVDLVAPGGEVFTDLNEDGFADGILQQTFFSEPTIFAYRYLQGTSMAAPHVAGAAALLISDGVHHPQAVRTALEQTALDLGAEGLDLEFGWGLIDVAKALRYWDNVSMPEGETTRMR